MIVRCASCQTEFSLDDRQVGTDGASVRCSVCGSVFRVEAAPEANLDQPWQIRTTDDLLFTAPDLITLRAWILEGRLHPDDRVSRTGRNFLRLGDMPEFTDAFAGFPELPPLIATEERGQSEISAVNVLGPPPAFGTSTPEAETGSPLLGVPESTTDAPSHIGDLSELVQRAAAGSSEYPALVPRDDSVEQAATQVRPSPPPPAARVEEDAQTVATMPPRAAVPSPMPSVSTPPPVRPPSESSRPRAVPPPAPEPGRSPMPRLGVPATISDDRSSRPASMLDAVTAHVRPIKQPVIEARPRSTSPAIEIAPSSPMTAELVRGDASSRPGGDGEDRQRRRRTLWPLWAALGTLGGAAVVFGIPAVRERVLGTTPTAAASTTTVVEDHGAVVEQAQAALRSAEPQALGRADAALQTTIATSTAGADLDELRALQADVLATRAIIHELWGAIEPTMRTDAWFWAQDDAVRAAAILSALGPGGSAAHRGRADALVRIVQRRVDPTVPASDEEARLMLAAAPMLRDERVKLPPDVVAAFAELAEPSVPARLMLALAHHRSGDDEAARAITTAVLEAVPEQPAARALGRVLAGEAIARVDPPDVTTPTPDSPTPDSPTPTPDSPTPTPTPTPTSKPAPSSSGEESASKLIDRGCSKVERGSAGEAVALLKRALEKRPGDLDALLCLGNAHAALGEHGNALRFYQRALDRSPNMMSALQGAAKSAAKLGREEQAVRLYKRLLEHDPGHDAARNYVKAHEGGGGSGADAGAPGDGSMG
ncbi:MAG TPA: zinc-ribbon domain-containing protein [Nannocystaceae bacterium]|nr:zinc-ribbon domain-containing protein [Nannocystaceae bacterium]